MATNLATNPSAEVNLDRWQPGLSTATLTRSTDRAHTGTACVGALWDGSAGAALLEVDLVAGRTYTAALHVWVPAGHPPVRATAYFNASGSTSTLTEQWERLEVTFTCSDVLDGTERVGIEAPTTTAATWAYVDSVIVVEGDTAPPYFDGDTPDTAVTTYGWTGIPHASRSVAELETTGTLVAPFHAPVPIGDATQDHALSITLVDVPDAFGIERTYPLPGVTTARIAWSATRVPRVRLDVTAAVPDEATLAALDPRVPRRIRVYAGYGDDVAMIADLGLRDRRVDRPSDTVTLAATSDEALILDAGAIVTKFSVTQPSLRDAIRWVLVRDVPDATFHVTGTDDTAVDVPLMGLDRWDLVKDLADRGDLEVWDDGTRAWHIAPRSNTTSETPHHVMDVGPDSTLTGSTAAITRSERGFYNRVVLFYRWRDDNDVNYLRVGYARIETGPFAAEPGATVTWSENRDVPVSQADADTAAAALLARMSTRGRSLSVSGIAAYWLRPSHTVRVRLPTGAAEDHLVEVVDFDLVAGSMTVTTRIPDNPTSIGGPA